MKKLLGIVLLVLILVVPLIILLTFFIASRLFPPKPGYHPTLPVTSSMPINQMIKVKNPGGKEYPTKLDWQLGDQLIISGYVVKNAIATDNAIVIKLPGNASTKDILVTAYFPSDRDQIMVSKMPNGPPTYYQDWVGMKITDLSGYLNPGSPVIVNIDRSEEEARKIIREAKQEGTIAVEPIIRAIIAE